MEESRFNDQPSQVNKIPAGSPPPAQVSPYAAPIPPAQPGAAPMPPTPPGAAPMPPTRPGAAPMPPTQPGTIPIPPTQPGTVPVPPSQPGAVPIPPTQPGAAPMPPTPPGAAPMPPTHPGAAPMPPTRPGTAPMPTTQPGTAPMPPIPPGAVPVPPPPPSNDPRLRGSVEDQFRNRNMPYTDPGYAYIYPPGQPYYMMPPRKKRSPLPFILLGILGILLIMSLTVVASVFAVLTLAGAEGLGSSSSHEYSYDENSVTPNAPDAGADPNGPQISTAEQIEGKSEETVVASTVYSKVAPSIVCVTSYKSGGDYTLDATGYGSGIIFSEDGYIVTNSHVVDDSKDTGVLIMLYDNSQYIGTVIGVDKKTDVAVIRINAEGLTPAEFADSSNVIVGELAFSIGNPGGLAFTNSLTKGTISAINRHFESDSYINYIQTDAAINPGSSGGALVNEHGQVVGMNTAKIAESGYEAMCFAVPSNQVREIANQLVKYGKVSERATLDITVSTVSLYQAKTKNVPQGVKITSIGKNSPLKKEDVKENDIITHIDDKRIYTSSEFSNTFSEYKPGDRVEITVFRPSSSGKGKEFKLTVELAAD